MAETNIILRADVTAGQIMDNFDDIRAAVIERVKPYQGLVFQDEDIPEAKRTASDLQKMVDAVEDKRKAIKKQWNEPYMLFEQKAKELVALITEPQAAIKAQINEYAERKRAEKQEQVEGIIENALSALDTSDQAFVRECGIDFNDRWLNVTYALSAVEKDVTGQVDHILKDVADLNNLCEDDTDLLTALLDEYRRTKDMPAVYAAQKRIIASREASRKMAEAKAEAEARRKAEEEARAAAAREAAQKAAEEPLTIDTRIAEPQGETEEAPEPAPAPRTLTVRFEVTGTLDEIKSVIAFMKDAGIQSRRIKEDE
jgi:chemotaxis protein histidine kinase CheA